MTLPDVQANIQQLAQVCQMNFQQMSENDKVLIDMAVTNTINIRAITKYLEAQGADLQPYINEELKERERQQADAQLQQAEMQKQATQQMQDQLKATQEEGPPPDEADEPLVFGGDFGDAVAPPAEETTPG